MTISYRDVVSFYNKASNPSNVRAVRAKKVVTFIGTVQYLGQFINPIVLTERQFFSESPGSGPVRGAIFPIYCGIFY
jgi:hypothetical protein